MQYPADLPITQHREELLDAIRAHQVVIVAGETGSGKSTQLPKLCLEAGRAAHGLIGHTQPRRVAARTIAERVAGELGETLGETVGYTVRFTDTVGKGTAIKVMTDGILLAEIQRDRMLRRYGTIIVDEAHERSLNVDFLLGFLTHLLAQRPELKLIVTSATLDTERFATHFGGAPIIAVSGRAYPVELRYRPFGVEPDDDRDQVGAIADAVDELSREGQGDILVFCSGEREIHDVADFLRRAELRDTEVLPLYARMSAAEQHRVFEPHLGRRVILATNVAETSVTVPGVRYVVDAGTARISRYSRRLKVQRLPIEPISRASADQRAGRCGRVGPGICIRLYAQDDYEQRLPFTEPEILRTSLAAVILQMTALGLGDISSFPFVEPPDPRSVNDGIALLEELGALESDRDGPLRLTRIGHRLAQLPVDPRLGRMVLESGRLGCAREVTVIAAALSIQDPRERPVAHAEAAAQAHNRFRSDDQSDFIALVRLWDHLRARQRELSGNQFRRLCRSEFLNYVRVREWQDLYSQLRQVAGTVGIHMENVSAHPDHIHQAVLAGLLSHVGMRDGDTKEFRGARGAKFTIARDSAQGARPGRWVMAAELVETNRLWARMAARVQPEWAERLGAHLVTRSYGEPEWDAGNGRAFTTERVMLYGLPLVIDRRVLLSRIDGAAARRLFIQHALVEHDWEETPPFVARNNALIEEIEALAQRTRRPDLAADPERIAAFFDSRLPPDIVSARHFARWWRDEQQHNPHVLDLTRTDLIGVEVTALDEFPEAWEQHEPPLPLSYDYAPGEERDGVTVSVPLATLNQLDPEPFTWLVPGLREEAVGAYVKGLPKAVRRLLVPAAEHVRMATMHLRTSPADISPADARPDDARPDDARPDDARPADFRTALAEQLSRQAGEAIDPALVAAVELPPHLRVRFAVVGVDGAVIAAGSDLRELQSRLRREVRREIAQRVGFEEQAGLTDWTFGTLAEAVETEHDGHVLRGYPALVDDGKTVHLRVLTSEAAARRATRNGVRRLLLLTVSLPRAACARLLTNEARLALARLGWLSGVDLVDDCVFAAVDHLLTETPRDEAGFRALQAAASDGLRELAAALTRTASRVVTEAAPIAQRLDTITTVALAPAVADMRAQLARLVHPGFVTETGAAQLQHLPRYLAAITARLDKLGERLARDRDSMLQVQRLAQHPNADRNRWLIEELRVSLFAQQLGTAEPVSVRRVQTALATVPTPAPPERRT